MLQLITCFLWENNTPRRYFYLLYTERDNLKIEKKNFNLKIKIKRRKRYIVYEAYEIDTKYSV